ncbi:hypothetical protein GGS20DRAFT_552403 [Poronia punctata]|nr:hypothetical protein GGS20DRAFT_552403 [Poronia punctata]
MQLSTILYSLAATSLTMAQRSPDPGDHFDLKTEGPFALRVRGHDKNNTIDGYLRTVSSGMHTLPEYAAGISDAPIADNSSYHFYFNYTEEMKTSSGIQLGFLATDLDADAADSPLGLKGQALTLRHELRSNVSPAILGSDTVVFTGFDDDDQSFLIDGLDDGTYVAGEKKPESGDYYFYRWAVCWQLVDYIYTPSLSWVAWGEARNPTCELVDLIKVPLEK